LTSLFPQLANNICDSDGLQELHARLANVQNLTQQVANKVDDVHELGDVKEILAKTRSATLRSSDTVVQQRPLKPGVFHGRDDIIEEITQLLMKEETSRICILGPSGVGKTSISLGVLEQALIKTRFLPENCIWVPCIEATSTTLLLEILYI
jgi:ATP-dependent Clp protease ATP-binding subunit ClpA